MNSTAYAQPVPTVSVRALPMPDRLKSDTPKNSLIDRTLAVKAIVDPVKVRRDVITIHDDGSADVDGMNGRDYTIDVHAQCSCPALKGCRHGEKLTAKVGAIKRMLAGEPDAVVVGDQIDNDKCKRCGVYPVTLVLWGRYTGCDFRGVRVYHCCGCGDKKAVTG